MKIDPPALKSLSDGDLAAALQNAVHRERNTTAEVIMLLMEVESRRLYAPLGYSSLFTYCTDGLHLSEHAAYLRIEAARLARQFPPVLERLTDGSINLTTVKVLAPHLTNENCAELLHEAQHKSRREVEQIAARFKARPEMCKLRLEVTRDTYDKFRWAQDLLRHRIPDGDAGAVFDAALSVLLNHLLRSKLAMTESPRPGHRPSPGSRHIPAAVRRTVWERDGARCRFVGEHGRCPETTMLEFHHVVPFADGGEATEHNIELRCRTHNQFEAQQWAERVGDVPVDS